MRRSQQGHGRPTVPMVYVSPPTKPCSGVPPFNRARRPRTVQTLPHGMQCQSGGRPELGLPMRGTLNKSAASLCKCSDAQQRRSFARGPCSAAPASRMRGRRAARAKSGAVAAAAAPHCLMVRKSQSAERILRPNPASRRFLWLSAAGSAVAEEEEAAPGDDWGLSGVRGRPCGRAAGF